MLLVQLVLVMVLVIVVLGDTTKTSQVHQDNVAKDTTYNDKDLWKHLLKTPEIVADYDGTNFNGTSRRNQSRSSIINSKNDRGFEYRQGRMALHTEAPISKIKREQTFRNILAAKRRQSLGLKRQDVARNNTKKNDKLSVGNLKDSLDMLEAEETRHGVFVTGPLGDQQASAIIDTDDDAAADIIIPVVEKIININNKNETSISTNDVNDNANKNTSQLLIRNLKNQDDNNNQNNTRKKNTVIMTESLYKHFHPVESNIPVEDMTQFLYFGQKIQPEKITINNHSNEVTSVSPLSTSSLRRSRYSTKRSTTTTTIPTIKKVQKDEDIMNDDNDDDDINITIEPNNKLQKSNNNNKNNYRTNSIYQRKLTSTVSSNIIIENNVNTTNTDETLNKNKKLKLSAHANQMLTGNPSEGNKTHRSNIIRDSTHIPDQVNGTESENINVTMTLFDTTIKYNIEQNNNIKNIDDRPFIRNKKSQEYTIIDEENINNNSDNDNIELEVIKNNIVKPNNVEITTESGELQTRLSTWMSVDPVTSTTINSTRVDMFNELSSPSSSSSSSIPTTPSSLNQHYSSLRIVVTEPMPTTSSSSSSSSPSSPTTTVDTTTTTTNTSSDINNSPKDTVSTVIPNRSTLSQAKKDPSSSFSSSSSSSSSSSTSSSSTSKNFISSKLSSQLLKNNQQEQLINNQTTIQNDNENNNKEEESPVASIQQMHPYAYTITNITRLLRNYTGPMETLMTMTTELTTQVTVETTMTTLTSTSNDIFTKTTTKDAELLPPLLVDVGIESMRERLDASAESAVVQTSSSVQQQLNYKNINTNLLTIKNLTLKNVTLIENLSTTDNYKNINGMEFDTSTIRWNYTNVKDNIDKDNNSDRRYLKKSASAVLNQRTSEENIRDLKRRRLVDITGRRNNNNKNIKIENNDNINDTKKFIKMSENNIMDKKIISEDSQTTLLPDIFGINDTKINNNDTIVDVNLKNSSVSENLKNLLSVNNTSRSLNLTKSDLLNSTIDDVTNLPTTYIIDSNNSTPIIESTTLTTIETTQRDLEPAEIQKMYRSQTTILPEPPITTLPPDLLTSIKPDIITSKSSERSPEVRGRNLSDKTKDKDDILPIMHLYNTSNIFNGSMMIPSDTNNKNKKLNINNNNNSYNNNDDDDDNAPLLTTLSTEKVTQKLPKILTTSVIDKSTTTTTTTTTTSTTNDPITLLTESKDEMNSRSNKNHQDPYKTNLNKTRSRPTFFNSGPPEYSGYHPELNDSYYEQGMISIGPREPINISEVITKRHDVDAFVNQDTVTFISYILATLVVFPIAIGVALILRRLILKNRKVLEESDTSSEISCRKDALNLENGDFKTSIEKAITKLPRIQHLCHDAEKPPPPPPPHSQESRWEFPRDKLRLQTVLGQGNFGQVWKAEADDLTGHQGTTRLVAVKTVKEGSSARENEDLVRELEIMQQLGNHPNVVTLLGCCTEEEPHYLILEYVMYGKLLAYLRDHRTRQDFYNFSEDSAALTSRDLTVFGYCVARGMEYLASKKDYSS
ncbi:probable serine/threonine-protein kinase nek3 isoform X2 [Aphidius gifuensis]|uniref:probable serine/threonine-protein kinase nek3 isoform X2 n=1 Tax=Aphidius gifuensis TaxID=684658 RepID=UPI001CDB762F|nr:probable serine/threonine-protein kinase nek3 isoform X2 [Aphidius gifuensis]